MTREEALMIPIRRLWAAVVVQGVRDYRKAIFEEDWSEARHIEKQFSIMGFGEYMPRLRENTERFRREIDREIRRNPAKRRRIIDCPACGAERKVWIVRRRKSVACACFSCGIKYYFPCWKLKEEEEDEC